MSDPVKFLTPWRVKHASGTTYTVLAGIDHASAIKAAAVVERYKFDCGDIEMRTFYPSPITELERLPTVYLVEECS